MATAGDRHLCHVSRGPWPLTHQLVESCRERIMNTYVGRTRPGESRTVANTAPGRQYGRTFVAHFADNREGEIAQGRIQALVVRSPQDKKMKDFRSTAMHRPKVGLTSESRVTGYDFIAREQPPVQGKGGDAAPGKNALHVNGSNAAIQRAHMPPGPGSKLSKKASREMSRLTGQLPYGDERWKEMVDPRRWPTNPYFRWHNQEEAKFEMNHGGSGIDASGAYRGPQARGYHARERHGAEHTFSNIHARTQAPTGGNLKKAGDSAMTHLRRPVKGYVGKGGPMPSSRFATPAWHNYTRNKAQRHFEAAYPGVSWPDGPALKMQKGSGLQDRQFSIEYEGSPAGISIDAGNSIARAHHVRSTIRHDPTTNQAWFVQHFPQTKAVTDGTVKNKKVEYEEIPWFSIE